MATKPKPSIDFGYPTEGRGPIPSFNSIDEEGEWWDTHDAEGNLIDPEELAELDRREQLAENLTLRLDQSDRAALTTYAKRKGIGPSTLAQIWIKEHLDAEAALDAKKAS
jgi:hypothetical protein